jgi:hypothetical protein
MKKNQSGLIHWAGCLRTPYISKMLRGDILIFFEKYYYYNIKMVKVKQYVGKILPVLEFYLKQLYYKIKSIGRVKE